MTTPLVRERDIQAEVVALYRSVGAHVYTTSAYRPGGAHIEAGIPDLICLLPRGKGLHFFETKRPKAHQTDDQILFEARCREAKVTYVVGGVPEATDALERSGILL